ncbi:sigma factor-like helix-turn-helix DNA-binding protein [Haladaptatus sp. NG-SE-30]
MAQLVEDVPIPRDIVGDVADRQAVSDTDLTEALATIHDDLIDGADAIHEYYVSENDGNRAPLIGGDGLVEVIFVDPERWTQMAERLGLSDDIGTATKAAHAAYAKRLGAEEHVLAGRDALVMPAHILSRLVRAGLSPRQAEVQVLRMEGTTQEEIGDKLGLEVGTVKSHCHRVDQKVAEARRLLTLLDE